MSNGAVLRKLGVALKRTRTPKKRAPGQLTAPPTSWDLKLKFLAANKPSSSLGTTGNYTDTAGKAKRRITENADTSGSDEYDDVSLAATLIVSQKETSKTTNMTEPHGSNGLGGQATSSGGQQMETTTILPSNYETVTEYTRAREAEIETNRRKNEKAEEIPK